MIKLGITGGIGSGKTTVSEIFMLCGIPVYIADVESKKLLNSSVVIRQGLIDLFGDELYVGGEIDKVLFASLIFNDDDKLQKSNQIIHPEVRKDFYQWIQLHNSHDVVALESAILFESGFNHFVDKTLTVLTPLELRIGRVMQRNNVPREKVEERIKVQLSDEQKAQLSDFVIDNSGSESLISQVVQLLKFLDCNN